MRRYDIERCVSMTVTNEKPNSTVFDLSLDKMIICKTKSQMNRVVEYYKEGARDIRYWDVFAQECKVGHPSFKQYGKVFVVWVLHDKTIHVTRDCTKSKYPIPNQVHRQFDYQKWVDFIRDLQKEQTLLSDLRNSSEQSFKDTVQKAASLGLHAYNPLTDGKVQYEFKDAKSNNSSSAIETKNTNNDLSDWY